MIRRPPRYLGSDPVKSQRRQIEFIDKDVDHLNRIVLIDPVCKTFRKQRRLPAINPFNEALHYCFEREAAIWVKLENHPNVVRCFYMNTIENTPFLFLEWVMGEEGESTDLRGWLARHGSLDPRLALKFVLGVCRALAHAERKARGFVHRDIKPENVLVAPGRLAKLTDFGLAKVVLEAGLPSPDGPASPASGRWQVTSAGGGTPAYMAPEQWRGEKVDARTDVYAVGCLLYELLNGHRPFQAGTRDGLMHAHLEATPPSLTAIVKGSRGERLDALVARCLAKAAGDRYASASELLTALSGLYEAWHGAPPRGVSEAAAFTVSDYSNRGNTYYALGRYTEALADCDAAIRLDPNCAGAYYNRGNTYTRPWAGPPRRWLTTTRRSDLIPTSPRPTSTAAPSTTPWAGLPRR